MTRTRSVEAGEEAFEPRPELDAWAFTEHQFLSEGGGEPYDLVVRFDRSAALVARERKWHPTQREETAEDGRLELRLRVCGRGDVLRWLLAFGGAVEVLEPDWLRERVRAEAAALLGRHRRRRAR